MNGFLALSAGHCLILVNVELNFPGNQISLEGKIPGKSKFQKNLISRKMNFSEKVHFPGSQISRDPKFPGKLNFQNFEISGKLNL